MIIVTTKTENHFLDEKDFAEITYNSMKQELTWTKTIHGVVSIQQVTDATPYNDKIEKLPEYDENLSIKRHNFEARINNCMHETIDIIYRVCTSKDVKHKDARENAIKNCESCIEYVRKEIERAKSEGIL